MSKFLVLTCIGLNLVNASAQAEPLAQGFKPTHMSVSASQETWKLPAGERMGMSSVGLMQEVSTGLAAGLRAYTATGGQRGGFITLGGVMQGRQPVGPGLNLEAEGFVGAGAGASGQALAGGGLMLRGALGVGVALPQGARLSVGVSRVRFPSGTIASTQPYVGLSLPFGVQTRLDGAPVSHYTHQFLPTLKRLSVDAGTRTTAGAAQGDLGLVGVEWRTFLNTYSYVALETQAAYSGASAGYMDIMAGGGLRLPLTQGVALYTDAMVGGGGGGAVATDSGRLAQLRVGTQLQLGRHWVLDASAARLRATDGSFGGKALGLSLGYQFGSPLGQPGAGLQAHALRLRLASQRYSGASADWRNNAEGAVGLVGAQLDYFVTPNWYLTGQGLAAATGGAGAYMTGLMGAGAHTELGSHWFAEAEAMLGAAGGGGLNTGSGALGQVNMNLGYALTPRLELIASLGRAQSSGGAFKANVVGVSLAYRMGVVGTR
ncbi:MAG: hypothetical protein RLZ63_296 [Pseudomonadota bacterium]|jgi:hypothetical protein